MLDASTADARLRTSYLTARAVPKPDPIVGPISTPTLLDALERAHPGRSLPLPRSVNSVLTIARAASKHSGYSVADIISHRHRAALCHVRFIVMYLSYRLTTMSFPEIGRHMDDRDHSTIIHGVHKIARLLPDDDRLEDDISAIRDLAIEADPRLGVMG